MNRFLLVFLLLGGCLFSSLTLPVRAAEGLLGHVAAIVSAPLGAGVGALRGALTSGRDNAIVLSDEMHPAFSVITAHEEPFTLESINLDGDFLDYDPYELNL